MAFIRFRKNEGLLVTDGEFQGAAVKFRRWAKNRKSLTATMINAFRVGGHVVPAGAEVCILPYQVMRSARKPSKKQGSRMILAICPECTYKIRASTKMFLIGVPSCPNMDCGLLGHTLEVEWMDEKTDAELQRITRKAQTMIADQRNPKAPEETAPVDVENDPMFNSKV